MVIDLLSSLNPSMVVTFIAVVGAIGGFCVFMFGRNPHKWKIFGVAALLIFGVVVVALGIFVYIIKVNAWNSVLQDADPYCGSSGEWIIPTKLMPLTRQWCPDGQLRIKVLSNATPAEVDLEHVTGKIYSQTKLDAKVTLSFSNGEEDYYTMAALLVQTPKQETGRTGGYGLWVNSTGYWELRDGGGKRLASGNVPSSASFTLEMKVFQGYLYSSINDKQVFTYPDSFNESAGDIALIANNGRSGRNVYGAYVSFYDFALSA